MDDVQLEEYRQRMRNRGATPQSVPSNPPPAFSAPPPAFSAPPAALPNQEFRPLLPQSSRNQVKPKESCLPNSSECWGVKSSYCVFALAAVLTGAILISLFLLLFL